MKHLIIYRAFHVISFTKSDKPLKLNLTSIEKMWENSECSRISVDPCLESKGKGFLRYPFSNFLKPPGLFE